MGWILLALLFTVAFAAWLGLKPNREGGVEWKPVPGMWAKVVLVGAFLLLLGATLASLTVIRAGQRGVVFSIRGGVAKIPLDEGIRFVVPVLQTVTKMDCQVNKFPFDVAAASKDLQNVKTQVTVNIYPRPAATPELFQKVGIDYVERIVHPAVQEVVKANTAKYTAEQLITEREKVKDGIQKELAVLLNVHGITLENVYITDFDFDSQFAQAVEQKQVAEQMALKAQRDFQRIEIEAKQKLATATAEAKAQALQRESLSDQVIKFRSIEMQIQAIQKWDGHFPQYWMGGGQLPFLSVMKVPGPGEQK